MQEATITKHIGIYVFEDVEVLDFAGPFEVFTTASRLYRRRHPTEPELFAVATIAQTRAPVRARGRLLVTPDHGFGEHPALDLLIVPGGVVTEELNRPDVIRWIQATTERSRLTASVCTGAFLLAKAGLLSGRAATTHWEDLDDLRAMFPNVLATAGVRWVDAGNIVTSAGISAGIDMSLHLVELLAGRELAIATARQMDFDWTENARSATATSAPFAPAFP